MLTLIRRLPGFQARQLGHLRRLLASLLRLQAALSPLDPPFM